MMKNIIVTILLLLTTSVYSATTIKATPTPTAVPTAVVNYDSKTGIYYTDKLASITITIPEEVYKENYKALNEFALITIPTSKGYLITIRGDKARLEKLLSTNVSLQAIKQTSETSVKTNFISYDSVKSATLKILEVSK